MRLDVTLSGVVAEATSTGSKPVSGVDLYCEACGEGHIFATTDSAGYYSFKGVWVIPGVATQLLVWKTGYAVVDAAMTFPDGTGVRYVMVAGETRFDIQLVPR